MIAASLQPRSDQLQHADSTGNDTLRLAALASIGFTVALLSDELAFPTGVTAEHVQAAVLNRRPRPHPARPAGTVRHRPDPRLTGPASVRPTPRPGYSCRSALGTTVTGQAA